MSQRRNKELKTLESLAKIFRDLATLTYSLLYQNFNKKPRRTQYKTHKTPKKTKKVWKPTGKIVPVQKQRGFTKNPKQDTSSRMSLDEDSEEEEEEEYFDTSSHDEEMEVLYDLPPDKPWDKEEGQRNADRLNAIMKAMRSGTMPSPRVEEPKITPPPKTAVSLNNTEKNPNPKRTKEEVAPSKEEETDEASALKKKIQKKGFDYGAIFRSTPSTLIKKPKTPDK